MRTKQATAQLPVGNLTNLANTYHQALASTFNLIYDGSNSCIALSLKAVRIMSNGAGANAASVKGRRSLCSRDEKLLFTVCVCTIIINWSVAGWFAQVRQVAKPLSLFCHKGKTGPMHKPHHRAGTSASYTAHETVWTSSENHNSLMGSVGHAQKENEDAKNVVMQKQKRIHQNTCLEPGNTTG